MAMTIYDRLKGIVSYRLLEQVAKMASEGDESKLAFLFETISRLSPPSTTVRPFTIWRRWFVWDLPVCWSCFEGSFKSFIRIAGKSS